MANEEVIEDFTFRSKRRGSSKNILIEVVEQATKEVEGSVEEKVEELFEKAKHVTIEALSDGI